MAQLPRLLQFFHSKQSMNEVVLSIGISSAACDATNQICFGTGVVGHSSVV